MPTAPVPPALPWPEYDEPQLWLGDHLRVLRINRAGRRELARHPTLLRLEGDTLRVDTASAKWPRALALARIGHRAALALPTPHKPRLSLLLEPATRGLPPNTVLLRLRSHQGQHIDQAVTRQLFDLTAREAEVAAALAEGHDPASIAEQLGVQTNTVRAHAKSAMTKIGVSRQSELAALLWRSVAGLPATVASEAAELSGIPSTPQAAGDVHRQAPDLARLGRDKR